MATNDPDPENEPRWILDIAEGFMKSQILFTSLELGIFDLLDKSAAPMTAVRIAEGIGADTDATKRLLDACAGLRLLQKVNVDKQTGDGEYQLSEASRSFLTSSRPTTLGKYVKRMGLSKKWGDLPRAIKEGPTFLSSAGLHQKSSTDHLRTVFVNKELISWMAATPAVFGARTASAFDLAEFPRICDIGGGSGRIAYHVAEAYPKAFVSVFDLPEVVAVAEEERPDGEYSQRVSFIPGDFFQDPLPPADLYVVSRILHDWTEDKVMTLLTKMYDSLPQGGSVLIAEHMLDDEKTGPEVAHKYDLHMMLYTGGRERSGQELKRLLTMVGFSQVMIKRNDYPFSHILARK